MAHIMPEVALRRVIEIGLAELRTGDRANCFAQQLAVLVHPGAIVRFLVEKVAKLLVWRILSNT